MNITGVNILVISHKINFHKYDSSSLQKIKLFLLYKMKSHIPTIIFLFLKREINLILFINNEKCKSKLFIKQKEKNFISLLNNIIAFNNIIL